MGGFISSSDSASAEDFSSVLKRIQELCINFRKRRPPWSSLLVLRRREFLRWIEGRGLWLQRPKWSSALNQTSKNWEMSSWLMLRVKHLLFNKISWTFWKTNSVRWSDSRACTFVGLCASHGQDCHACSFALSCIHATCMARSKNDTKDFCQREEQVSSEREKGWTFSRGLSSRHNSTCWITVRCMWIEIRLGILMPDVWGEGWKENTTIQSLTAPAGD